MDAFELCLCGARVDVIETSLRAFTEPHVIRGCKACKFTGTREVRETVASTQPNTSNG